MNELKKNEFLRSYKDNNREISRNICNTEQDILEAVNNDVIFKFSGIFRIKSFIFTISASMMISLMIVMPIMMQIDINIAFKMSIKSIPVSITIFNLLYLYAIKKRLILIGPIGIIKRNFWGEKFFSWNEIQYYNAKHYRYKTASYYIFSFSVIGQKGVDFNTNEYNFSQFPRKKRASYIDLLIRQHISKYQPNEINQIPGLEELMRKYGKK